MSNPAPTLNQINAFNATQGTTIDFNIIGGTEVIRSNKIYIYDLSDNSLICTHLYVSTESIHELPPNTSSSIVYASGKSSADFTNNTQYYAQIQTFTDVGGTQGGSGLSIAKLFWCLPTPTLTLSTIPTTISTTSYNVSATYTPNTSGGATNEIQQFQFNLYSAIGTLLQTSGVVLYGEGVDLSYNFSGLEIDSTYYVTLDITTTQGMNVSAQSNTFTVSIDTPTMGSASVVNNGCDGYISVTSNLSSEYKHEESVGSGDIMSFTTESLNDVVKLVVDIDPIQDLHGYDKPWVGGAGKNKFESLDGKANNVTFARQDDGTVLITGTATSTSWTFLQEYYELPYNGIAAGGDISAYTDKYMIVQFYNGSTQVGTSLNPSNGVKYGTVPAEATRIRIIQYPESSQTTAGTVFNTVAHYYVGTETNGAFTSWTPYSNICPITGWTGCEVNVRGVNLWDEVWEVGSIDATTGANQGDNSVIRSKNYIPILPKTQYYYYVGSIAGSSTNIRSRFYDINKNYIGSAPYGATYVLHNAVFTSPENAYYMRFAEQSSYGATYKNDISINYPSSDHTYHAHNPNSAVYPITWQTEAGTVYGGTVDLVTGVLKVDRAKITYTGQESEDWGINTTSVSSVYFTIVLSDSVMCPNTDNVVRCISETFNGLSAHDAINTNSHYSTAIISNNRLYVTMPISVIPTSGAVATFKTWLSTNPLTICYELASPQTIQLTPTEVSVLLGQNNVWNNINGGMSIIYQLPITDLLVKRKDVADVSGKWLTLYSTPITQASDMDFTFIDFLNQYGKTYQYALVPVLAQDQSGVIVKIEGGYTVSDNVDSIFDGVYIADQTNVERVKAGVGYGNIDMNQGVGSVTPIGSKYPIVITNSQNQYHNGSIRGTIVPNDFYANGNLSRIDMVNKRDELEQFLTNKRAKIIKDWNGKIWLVMIMSNVNCSFDDNYGMGMVSFSADWLEVGDPTNQQDLYNAGLINVGGV